MSMLCELEGWKKQRLISRQYGDGPKEDILIKAFLGSDQSTSQESD